MRRTRFAAAALAALGCACGEGEIDLSEVQEGSILNARPWTLRDGGEPVNGTLVARNADGEPIEEREFVDGFPNGRWREWYDNGQLKRESVVAFANQGRFGGRVTPVGKSKSWCENGTLQAESDADDDGTPVGVSRTWTCAGDPLQERALPFGPLKQWQEVEGSKDTVLVEEGTLVEGGGWDGAHKQYWASTGKPRLEEHWVDGARDGAFKSWAESGELIETGSFKAGKKVGTWTVDQGYGKRVTEYDPSSFVDLRYADAFMAACGIELTRNLALRNLRADLEKIRYYASQGLVDVKKRLNFTPPQPDKPFESTRWTYPYILASAEALPLLVELGADPKAVDSEGRTRLFYCIYSLGADRFCSGAEAKRLIDLGLSPNHADFEGNTPLHEVVKTHPYLGDVVPNEKRAEVARILMEAGADPDVQNAQGKTPIMLAIHWQQLPLAAEMLERSKKPDLKDENGLNLIHLAFYDELSRQFRLGLTDEIKRFVDLAASKGVDPAAPIGEMGTLREISEQAGAIDLAQYLATLKK